MAARCGRASRPAPLPAVDRSMPSTCRRTAATKQQLFSSDKARSRGPFLYSSEFFLSQSAAHLQEPLQRGILERFSQYVINARFAHFVIAYVSTGDGNDERLVQLAIQAH